MLFSNILGHQDIIRALEASLANGKIGHAYLFLGPAGVGKKTLARQFAAGLLCPQRAGNCEAECVSCRQFHKGSHPDFVTVSPSGNSVKIEQLRELQRNAYLKPLYGGKKVFFFPEADRLTEAAANSFLKILEEPPEGVIFLFTAVKADSILPTIRSRCQVYPCFPIPTEEINSWLRGKGFSEEESSRRALGSQGLPGAALNWVEEPSKDGEIGITEILDMDLLNLLKLANQLEKKERREVLEVLREWESQLRAAILQLVQEGKNPIAYSLQDQVAFSEKLTQVIMMIENNVNQRMALEEFFLLTKVHPNNTL